jgi:hypothetical protein
LRDDGAFGSIESVDPEARTLRFDSGVFLEGSRADEVAAEDGVTVQRRRRRQDRGAFLP